MGIFGKILGTDKAMDVVDKGLQGGIKLLDSAFYTDQEKSEFKAKTNDLWLKSQELISKESSPTSISRRVIAWAIIGLSAFVFLVGILFISIDEMDKLNSLIKLAEVMSLNWAFTGVIGFYFLPHVFGRARDKIRKE